MKKLMLGNEAIARGAYEAGVVVTSSYPGTPSTEITEYISKYDEIYSEWATNEKVAMEVAVGASIAGGRALTAMKHVGLNVAADPLFTASYTGVNGGLVICVADDQGMHSSQDEQDSRNYALFSKVVMLEPSDSEECKSFLKLAYEISEEYDTPVLLRLSTRVSHSRSLVEINERENIALKDYVKDPMKYVMMPAMARLRHVEVEKRISKLKQYSETSNINTIEYNDKKIGIISAGIAYQYAKEALGEKASYLKLGMVYPLPENLIKDFVSNVDICYVIEELDPFIENHCKNIGVKVLGKDKFSLLGEYSSNQIKKVILNEDTESFEAITQIPNRPPVMCSGCPHRGVFFALKQLGLTVSGDIGCYTLGALPPINSIDTSLCMGASIGIAHGMEKAIGVSQSEKTVAIIGDSTFMHSGVTGLINTVYNNGNSTVIIMDNSITGMTGHQQNPTTGLTIKGEPARQINLEKLCEAIGVKRVTVVDPFNVGEIKRVLKEEVSTKEPSVIISRRPCALLKTFKSLGKRKINKEICTECGMCLKIACPSIIKIDGKITIDKSLCVGCTYCTMICKFNAIEKDGE